MGKRKTYSWFLICVISLLIIFGRIVSTSAVSQNAIINVDSITAVSGSTIEVNVEIRNNPGVLGATLELSFDKNLTLTNATQGEAWSCLTMTKPGRFTSPCRFVWDGQEISDDQIKDGVILTLTFEVAKDATSGTDLPVSIEYEYGDVADANLDFVSLDVNNGRVIISDEVSQKTATEASKKNATESSQKFATEASKKTATESIQETTTKYPITDDQVIDAVEAALGNTENRSIDDIESDTLEEVNENLRTIAGPNAPQFSSLEELKERYKSAKKNDYIEQAKTNLAPDKMKSILNEILNSRGVESFSELEGEEKSKAIKEAFQKLHEADNLIPEAIDSLTDDEAAEMFDSLLEYSSSETSTPDTKVSSSKNNNAVIVTIVVTIVLVLICGLIILIKKKKTKRYNS